MTRIHSPPSASAPYRRLVLILGVGHFLAFVDRAKLTAAMPAIRKQIAMSDTAAGWVIGTAFAIGYGLTAIGLVPAVRRWGGRAETWLPAAGIALWGAAGIAIGLADSVPFLIAARVAAGIGQALFIPAAASRIVEDGAPFGLVATSLARFTAASSFGRAAGLLAFGAAVMAVGAIGTAGPNVWRWSFGLLILPNLLLLVVVSRQRRAGAAGVVSPPATAPDAARSPAARAWPFLIAVPPVVLVQALAGWLPTLVVGEYGETVQSASIWVGALTLVGGAGSQLIAGRLLQRRPFWSRRTPLLVALGLGASLPAILLLGLGGGRAMMIVGALLALLTAGIANFAALFGAQQAMSPERRLAGNGLFFAVVTSVGVGMGPLVAGVLIDGGASLRTALLWVAIGCAAAAGGLAAKGPPMRSGTARD